LSRRCDFFFLFFSRSGRTRRIESSPPLGGSHHLPLLTSPSCIALHPRTAISPAVRTERSVESQDDDPPPCHVFCPLPPVSSPPSPPLPQVQCQPEVSLEFPHSRAVELQFRITSIRPARPNPPSCPPQWKFHHSCLNHSKLAGASQDQDQIHIYSPAKRRRKGLISPPPQYQNYIYSITKQQVKYDHDI